MTKARAATATLAPVKGPLNGPAHAPAGGPVRRPGKAAILRAAIEVMGELGYEGASMRDMAGRAGVSVAALYHHFPSKVELLREFLDEAYDVTMRRLVRRMAEAEQTPAAQLDELVGTLIASSLHDEFARLAANVAFHEYTRLPPPERKRIDKKRRRVLDLATRVIEAGVQSGEFGASDPKEAARAVLTLASSLVAPFDEMNRSMTEVIALYQGFARSIAIAPLSSVA
jgi:AcrR family transcriptional regulator